MYININSNSNNNNATDVYCNIPKIHAIHIESNLCNIIVYNY